ncbi:hypothetical protein [Legionella sp. W05-934-2]|uniref:hypothetical protein n=1 Tax=Legionella sp. W05-934-2 TaxID=1198649 RepID=UPI003462C26F
MTIPENSFTIRFEKKYGKVQFNLLIDNLNKLLGNEECIGAIRRFSETTFENYESWENFGYLREYENKDKGYLKFLAWVHIKSQTSKLVQIHYTDKYYDNIIRLGISDDPDFTFALLDGVIIHKLEYRSWFKTLFSIAEERPDFTHPVLEVCLLKLINNGANYFRGTDRGKYNSCDEFKDIKSIVQARPYSIFSRILYHDAIIRAYPTHLLDFKEAKIKLKLDPELINKLIPEPLSKSQCLGFKKNIECLGINNYIDQDEVDCIMNILDGRTLTYSTPEYPPILTKFLQGVGSSKKSPPTLNELIASLYMQLDIYKDMFDKFFVNRSFAVLREPIESSLKSLEEFLLPHNRSEVLRYFSEQPLNPNPTTEGPILELCSIAMHPDLPKEMQSKVIQLIDEISSLKIQAVKVIKLESSGSIDKTLPQTSLSFFDKPSSNNSLASKQEESQYPRHG